MKPPCADIDEHSRELRALRPIEDPSSSRADMPERRFGYLDSFRAVAMLMVVGVHVLGYIRLDPETNRVVTFLVFTIGVPAFFLVDGFLFGHARAQRRDFDYAAYVLKSCRRLLLPWAIFTCAFGVLRALFEYEGYFPERLLIGQSWPVLVKAAYLSQIAPQMYFLLSLFCLRLLAKVSGQFLRLSWGISALVWCFYVVAFHVTDIERLFPAGLDPIVHAIWGAQFYMLGMLLYRHHAPMVASAGPIAVAAGTLLAVSKSQAWGLAAIDQYAFLIGCYAAFLAGGAWLKSLEAIGRSTMGIYLLHAPILVKGVSLCFSGFLVENKLGQYLLVVGATFGLSLLLARIVMASPAASVLFGESRRINGSKHED